MCQSKAEGGKRCAAHNNKKEHNLRKRELNAAVRKRDSLIAAHESGNARVTAEDIAAAEHEVLVKTDLVLLTDPKLTQEQLDELWEGMSHEVQDAARPVAQEIVEHEKAAAKLAGQAHTARMFDRLDTAEEFEEEAEQERSKAARLADALRAALTEAKTKMSEGVQDSLSGEDSAVGGGFLQTLREFAQETADAYSEGLDEMVDSLAEGMGIAPAPTLTTTSAASAPASACGAADTPAEVTPEASGDYESPGQEVAADDADSVEIEHEVDVADDPADRDEEVVVEDSPLLENLQNTIRGGEARSHVPAQARRATGTASAPVSVEGEGTSASTPTPTTARGDGDGAGTSRASRGTSVPSSRASGGGTSPVHSTDGSRTRPSTRPTPDRAPFPLAIPLRGTRVDPRHVDVQELSDAELLAWITELDKELEAV